jgi:pimeloyl-ACP methyl ester carboxylesterase
LTGRAGRRKRVFCTRGGCGGGDLALEIATATGVAAIVAEEPASMMFTGVFNATSSKAGERYTPADSGPIMANPGQYYLEEYQKFTRAKIATIHSPVLLIQGEETSPLNRWNAEVLVPELRRAGFDKCEWEIAPGVGRHFAKRQR